jgi:hypothetical protein
LVIRNSKSKTYGFAHIVKASEVMSATTEESFGDNAKKAAAFLKQAAGIFEYAASKEFPRYLLLH